MSTSRRNFIVASARPCRCGLVLDSQPTKLAFASEKPVLVGEPKFREYSSSAISLPRLKPSFLKLWPDLQFRAHSEANKFRSVGEI